MTASRPLRASADSVFGVTRLGEGALRNAAVTSQPVLIASALAAAAIGTGWLVARGEAKAVALALVIALVSVLAVRAPATLAAVLLLAAMNGVPLVNLSGRLPGGAHIQDGAVIALGVLLFVHQDRKPNAERARLIRVATIWSACFVAFWIFTVVRSVLLDAIPWLKAMLYGRDFLYFALLLPLALRARFPPRSVRTAAWVLLAGVVLYSVGATVTSLTGISLPWLVHPDIVDPSLAAVTRLYSLMSSLVNTCLVFSGALLLSRFARGRRWRVGALAVLLILAAALELTRANYFALGIAVLAGVCVAMIRYGKVAPVVVRGALCLLVLLAIGLSLSVVSGSQINDGSVLGTVVSRVETGVSDLSQSTGTVGYRETVDRQMLRLLGTSWPLGLGFLHPSAHYVPSLPFGTIRNSDTGVFNVLMTMGIAGVFLIYAPLAYGLRELLRTDRYRLQPWHRWIVYGGVAWIAWAVSGSVSLIVLFSVSGLTLTALVLAWLAQEITRAGDEAPFDPRDTGAAGRWPGLRSSGAEACRQ